jgi:hypothetical protein
VSSGSGVILDPNATFTKEINPLFTYVAWANYSASATYLTSSQNTYIYVDSVGTIHQQTNFFDQTQYEQAIPLGRVTHPNYISITGIGSNVQTTYDSDSQQSAFVRAFGPLKVSGFSIQAHPGSLSFGVGSGTAFTLGGFYSQDPNSPSHYNGAATPTASIARAYRSGSGIRLDNNGGAFYTTIDPDYWDDGTGVLNTMSTGDWQIQRVFFNPVSGRSTVYYGQTTYTTLLNALQYLATDSFTEGDFTANSLIFIGYLVLKGQTNNIADTSNNRVINSGIFRNIAGGSSGAGAVAQNLNDLSDVTITTPSNGQSLVYNSGTWENGTPVLASTASYVLQAVSASFATSASFAASGNGSFTGSFTGSFIGDGSQLTGIVSSKWSGSNPITRDSSVEITGSFKVAGQTTFTTTGSGTLKVQGSGSAQPLFLVTGSVGELLLVIDQDDPNEPLLIVSGSAGQLFVVENSTTGSLLQIYDTGSNSIFSVEDNGNIMYGVSSSIFSTQQISILATASYQTIYDIQTGSYSGAFVNYTAISSSNARAGQVMSVWRNGTASYAETTTTDIGDTSQIAFDVVMTGSVARIAVSASLTTGWQVKTTLNIL